AHAGRERSRGCTSRLSRCGSRDTWHMSGSPCLTLYTLGGTLSTVALLGSPPPSLLVEPKGIRDSAWAEAVDLLAAFGLELDEWQELYMQVSLSERTDGKWADLGTLGTCRGLHA